MNAKTKYKCLHCSEIHLCDFRNRGRQRYCPKPECRRVSKACSQRQWVSRPENQNYFRGSENSERVRQWRREHPGYWRKKKAGREDALQETCPAQGSVGHEVEISAPAGALQDICFSQPALLVGLISVMTGHALQEDIAASTRWFLSRGEDILRMKPGSPQFTNDENQAYPVSRTFAAGAASI
jgi:hypothetical protein